MGRWDAPYQPTEEESNSPPMAWSSTASYTEETSHHRSSRCYRGGAKGPSDTHTSPAHKHAFTQKIFVDGLFPSHVRPASVLIGTRGMNHHKMQSSGCIVQLRGRGCSAPGQPSAEEPVHLLVKYDTQDQLDRFKEILADIIKSCDTQAPRRANNNSRSNPNHHHPPPSSPSIPSTGSPPSSFLASCVGISIPDWDPASISPGTIDAEGEFLWLIYIFLQKEKSVFLDELAESVAVFFCVDSIKHQLSQLSISPGPNQLRDFVRSCPHLLKLQLEPGLQIGAHGEIPPGSRPRVQLAEGLGSRSKEQFKDLHRRIRHEQAEASVHRVDDIPVSEGMPEPSRFGRTDLPLTLECLLLQALCYLIYESKETSFVGLEERFFARTGIPLRVSEFGYPSLVAFVKSYSKVFKVIGSGRDMRVSCLTDPDFAETACQSSQQKSTYQFLDGTATAASTALAAALARQNQLGQPFGTLKSNHPFGTLPPSSTCIRTSQLNNLPKREETEAECQSSFQPSLKLSPIMELQKTLSAWRQNQSKTSRQPEDQPAAWSLLSQHLAKSQQQQPATQQADEQAQQKQPTHFDIQQKAPKLFQLLNDMRKNHKL